MDNKSNVFELGKLLEYEQPSKYIVESTDYNDSYLTPVLTAGKTFVLGYTNEQDGIYDNLPVIIFDDFTTASRYVNFPFKVKSSAMKILKPNLDLVDPKYIYYRMQIINIDHSTHKRYWIQQYSKIKISIPTLPEQKRIVARIEELFSNLDSAVETLQKTKQQLEVYRQAVLREAFADYDTEVCLNEVCRHITDGDHMPPPKAEKGIPFIMISNIQNNIINWDNTAYVGEDYFSKINEKRTPKKGDVLYTVTGSFGIPVIIDFEKPFCFQRHIALLRPNDRILQKYLFYVLQSPQVYQQAKDKSTGTAQKTVGLNVLRKIEIPFVDNKSLQNDIVTALESKLTICDSIKQTIDQSLQQAEAMRQSILKQAFEGEL